MNFAPWASDWRLIIIHMLVSKTQNPIMPRGPKHSNNFTPIVNTSLFHRLLSIRPSPLSRPNLCKHLLLQINICNKSTCCSTSISSNSKNSKQSWQYGYHKVSGYIHLRIFYHICYLYARCLLHSCRVFKPLKPRTFQLHSLNVLGPK